MTIQTVKDHDVSSAAPLPQSVADYGALSLLAAHCPLHRSWSAADLNRLFFPAVQHKSVRVFRTASNQPCAALIWARLSDAVAQRMFTQNTPPSADEWASGSHLWFLDLIAPFGHGADVARHLARNPPDEPFSFARLGADGTLRKRVDVDGPGELTRSFRAIFSPLPRDG